MDEFDAAPRRLPWELRDQVSMSANTQTPEGDDNPFTWPEDPDERTLIVFNLSQREYTAIASAIDVGSDIAFGADAIKVWWLFVQNMRYNVSLCDAIAQAILTCEDVQAALATAIATVPAIQEAIIEAVQPFIPTTSSYPTNQSLPSGVAAGNISIDNPGCDKDILWSQCVGMVQTANRMTTDFLETWETYTNSAETIPAIVGAIPFLGEVADIAGVDAVFAYANSIIDSIHEGYAADYTLEYENTLACEIFCESKDTCEITLDQLCDIMNSRISGQLNLSNGIELMLSLIDADVSGINIADLYLAAFFNMLRVANLVLPITWGIEAYLNVTRTFNVGSDDWELLCTDCPEPPADCFEFSIDEQGWIPVPTGWAQYTSTEGWGQNGAQPYVQISLTGVTEEITTVRVHFTRPWSGATVNPDYDKFYIIVSGGPGSTSGPVTLPGAPTFLTTGQQIDVPAQTDSFWTGSITVSVIAGGNTWPGSGGNPASPQYIDQICFNPD